MPKFLSGYILPNVFPPDYAYHCYRVESSIIIECAILVTLLSKNIKIQWYSFIYWSIWCSFIILIATRTKSQPLYSTRASCICRIRKFSIFIHSSHPVVYLIRPCDTECGILNSCPSPLGNRSFPSNVSFDLLLIISCWLLTSTYSLPDPGFELAIANRWMYNK